MRPLRFWGVVETSSSDAFKWLIYSLSILAGFCLRLELVSLSLVWFRGSLFRPLIAALKVGSSECHLSYVSRIQPVLAEILCCLETISWVGYIPFADCSGRLSIYGWFMIIIFYVYDCYWIITPNWHVCVMLAFLLTTTA